MDTATARPGDRNILAEGYLVSRASLGAAAGAISAGPISDRLGRKKLLIIDAALCSASTFLGFKRIDKFGRRKLATGGYVAPTVAGADGAGGDTEGDVEGAEGGVDAER